MITFNKYIHEEKVETKNFTTNLSEVLTWIQTTEQDLLSWGAIPETIAIFMDSECEQMVISGIREKSEDEIEQEDKEARSLDKFLSYQMDTFSGVCPLLKK